MYVPQMVCSSSLHSDLELSRTHFSVLPNKSLNVSVVICVFSFLYQIIMVVHLVCKAQFNFYNHCIGYVQSNY